MFRKLIPICLFLAGAILGKPMALGTLGFLTKAYLYFESGWQFSYGSIDWHEGKLIFREIRLTEPSLSLHAKRVSVLVGARHLEIEQPTVALKGMPRMKNGGGEWTLEMRDGTIAADEFGAARFSFEKTWRHHLGRLSLERQGSRLAIEAIRVGNEIWVDADLHRFQAETLKSWIDLKGCTDGRIHLVFEGSECKRGSVHLDFCEAGYGQFLSGGLGTLDWEGNVKGDFFTNCLESMRMRLQLSKAALNGSKGGIEDLKGNFSFTAGVGARWEFEAKGASKGQAFPILWNGKAFLHDSRPFWAESVASCRGASITVKGEQEENGFRWKGKGKDIGAVEGTLIQSMFSLASPQFEELDFEQGVVHFEGEALFGKAWILSMNAENLACQYQRAALKCRNAAIQWTSQENGTFQFSGASAQTVLANDKNVSGEGWQGSGEIEQGVLIRSLFEGSIENVASTVALTGALEGFQLGAKGENFEVAMQCAWKERIDFEIEEGSYEGISFKGAGWVEPEGTFSLNLNRFDGALSSLSHFLGVRQEMEGRIESIGHGLFVEGDFRSYDWFLQAKGELGNGLGFYCPIFEKRDETFSFDVRIETPTWDLVRLVGKAGKGECSFDSKRTHVMGMPAEVDSCTFDWDGLESMKMKVPVSWKSLIAAAPLWFPEANKWIEMPIDGTAIIDLAFSRKCGSMVSVLDRDLTWKGEPVFLHCSAVEENGAWHISHLQIDDCTISAHAQIEGETLHLSDGHASWKRGLETQFYGNLDSSFHFEFFLPRLKVSLSDINPITTSAGIPLAGLQGILEGKGMISRKGKVEADFDFSVSNLKAALLDWNNAGPIHLRYESDAGILCSGLDLSGRGPNLPFFVCKIGLLQFDAPSSLWILNHSHFRLPPRILDFFSSCPTFLMKFNPHEEMEFSADLRCPSDFSSLSFSVKEVSIPVDGTSIPIRNLSFSIDETDVQTRFDFDHQGYPIKVAGFGSFGDGLSGRLTLEDGDGSLEKGARPLSIDWSYSNPQGLLIREVEGRFGGVEASFHALDAGTTLIGSARVDFRKASKIIPPRISQVFTDLNMGKGYELKGKLSLEKGVSFKGLFTGKQIDLFGYQLRTLLSQFEFSPECVRLYDLKISDSAGILKIDELVAAADGERPWTISIPHLTILELRPSLLQIPNREPQPAGPLVVREMKIDDFKGLLEDSKTYTAKGSLSFINSFRREHTLFDIPSDLLGRIVGLDLEILIPACGNLDYELKDGLFYLTALYDSFSEAKRTEFFLVPDPPPTMDLDGNLHILVSMKQFVIFKLTESFQIFVDGKLDDPQFHLQKKRRFLGL
jgi:hypothetical protein